MKVYILEEEFDLDNNNESIEEIFNYIKQALDETDYHFSFMKIDGEEIYDEFEIFLEDNIESVSEVEVIMSTTKEMIIDNLLTINEYVEGGVPIINNLANSFSEKPETEDWQQLRYLFEGIGFILHTFENINTMENLNEIIDNREVWNDYSKQVKLLDKTLEKFKQATEDKDNNLISNLLNDEVVPVFKKIKEQLDILTK